ncbi:MaoC family dehydratase [Microbacterium sp. BH-3-3-3]|uniref:MaoC family dehydratase n=1 Tax=Microbacterium sp. BH-3-3-3 TaxID=1906742 RepID=UPI0008928634|nr:MaoC family dehydratase [Microbacterium sp. BH-3-3-3]AOX45901.1 enoyl-CoA hydratase [Microbacterium sp. BH-3-3-3]
MSTTVSYDDIAGLTGTDLGWSEWLEITQDRVNLFAHATDDHQWIHTDPERAKDGPFGGAIAHGFLSLSLAVNFWTELLDVTGVTTKVNYGLDKVRFISPVKVGAHVRMNAVIAEVTEIAGGYQLTVDQTIEIDGGGKPAVVARGLYRFYA